jgi:membrane protease YdiL (CAAX protease family)
MSDEQISKKEHQVGYQKMGGLQEHDGVKAVASTPLQRVIKKIQDQRIVIDIIISCGIILCVGFLLSGFLLKLSNFLPEKLIYEIANLISIVAAIAYLIARYQLDFSFFLYQQIHMKRMLLWGAVSGFILGFINFPYTVITGNADIPKQYLIDSQQGILFVSSFLIIVIIIIPFLEELFFRAFVYRMIKNRFDIFWGYVASVVLFWAGHDFYMLTIISALIYCYIYEKTGLIGTSIIAHSIRNFIWYSAIYMST